MKRIFTWYIEPLDSSTNEVLSNQLPEEDYCNNIKCENGRHNLWKCNWKFIEVFLKSQKNFNLKFGIYCKQGNNGKIKESDFLKKAAL
jgi:hypothetical protein